MSAIAFSNNNRRFSHKSAVIGAHADIRHEDFFFQRMQSQNLREARWESRIHPMLSWSEIILYGVGGLLLVLVALSVG
jgi:hypothetical protein